MNIKSFHVAINREAYQQAQNTAYPEIVEIRELEDLKAAAEFDHVGGEYRDSLRAVKNFLRADCVIMDIDNDETENKDEWINPPKLATIFPDVQFYAIFSKSDGVAKGQYSPRPRFHTYFPLSQAITDADKLRALKEELLRLCPAFDKGAADAARFFNGLKGAKGVPYRGELCIDEFIANYQPVIEPVSEAEIIEAEFADIDNSLNLPENIQSGARNSTLYAVALKALVNYELEQAKQIFKSACDRCIPPLPDNELRAIWQSALKSNAVRNKNERQAQPKKILVSNDLSRIIKGLNIQARLNKVTGKAEVVGLPLNSPYVAEDFKNLTPAEQMEHGAAELRNFLMALLKHENFLFTADYLKDILSAYLAYHAFNPVLDMLETTQWDGVDRILSLGQILNIADNAHYMAMLRKWLIQAVAILFNDGNNSLDFVLTLQGRQGLGKTEFFRIIGMRPDWVKTGTVIDMAVKDSRIEATSCWICEIGELDNTLRKEQTSLKAFISQTVDRYRRPYASEFEDRPRRTCFCATVNDARFLRDPTGNRRWVVIPVEKIDLDTLHSLKYEWLAQLWRQAYELYLSGATFRLTPEERERNEQQNKNCLVFLPAEQ